MPLHHPWRVLRTLTGWTLLWRRPASGARAETVWSDQTIEMDPSLLQAERRSVLAHELEHVARGPFPRWATGREEAIVSEMAARKLIGIDDLADALAWSLDPHEVAHDLWVDIPLLRSRVQHLTDIERRHLRERLAHLHDEENP